MIFVQLNEINFETVARYIEDGERLPAFKHLLDKFGSFLTVGEEQYDELEPWIQWVSAYTGKTFAEHGVFRLGDAVNLPSGTTQIFGELEKLGCSVGAVAPMNARNDLANPCYFIPDPWTDTSPDTSGFSRRFTAMLRQTVNDNAQGNITLGSLLTLAEAAIRSFSLSGSSKLISLIFRALRRPWLKALVLDYLIHIVHRHLVSSHKPDVSFVFLNAGAHIQHHYFLNSRFSGSSNANPEWYMKGSADPFLDMLYVYDGILGDYLKGEHKRRLIVATGLSQVPYDRVKFYYRLKDHLSFVRKLGIQPEKAMARMTRDFELHFETHAQANMAQSNLAGIKMARDGRAVFGDFELKGASLFLSLVYPEEILRDDAVQTKDSKLINIGEEVVFVAIKNGMHHPRGYCFYSKELPISNPGDSVHVLELYNIVKKVFP